MVTALIGFTGFVGQSLMGQTGFDLEFNRANISTLADLEVDLAVCAAAPAAKWIANRDPLADLANLELLMTNLDEATIRRVILISTVDVYPTPVGVDELSPTAVDDRPSYGANRSALERFVSQRFDSSMIVRLPALFGSGLRKNFVFDLLHRRKERFTHHASVFQLYNMERLWSDITRLSGTEATLVNLVSEPVSARRIAKECFDVDYLYESDSGPVEYDVRSRYAHLNGGPSPYMYTAASALTELRRFAESESV